MSTVVSIFGIVFASNGLFALVQFLITRKDKNKDDAYVRKSDLAPMENDIKSLQTAARASLKSDLNFKMTKCLRDGYVSANDLECIRDLLTEYEHLNGDGFIHTLWERVEDLPIEG